jgi:hypothetical protein
VSVGQPHGAQDGSVAAQTDEQIGSPGELLGGTGGSRASETIDFLRHAEDRHPSPCGPAENRVDNIG